jgi:glycosyltransferase involved in cell wall biosynthesis
MKILNISSIIPLPGLKRENDIILRIQDYLEENYEYEFTIVKALPFVPFVLSLISDKWKKYREYQQKKRIKVQGYNTIIYPWLMPPTSNFWINYFLIPLNWIWYKLVVKKRISIEARNTDLLLAQNLIPDAIVAYWLHKKYDKPYIINIRGKTQKYWFKLPMLRSVIKNAAEVITHSPTNYQAFNDDYEIQLIPHPVDDIFYFNGDKKYNYPKLVSACRLLSLKNIDKVLESLANLKKSGLAFEYRIIGDGPEMKNLKRLVQELGLVDEVSFKGYLSREKVAAHLKDFNIFIMPSYPETLGRAFLEAAAAGCLIIGHKNTGVDGLFLDRESAVLVDNQTLSMRLENVISNFSKENVHNYIARSRKVIDKLRWSEISQKYNEIYSSVIEYD